LNGGQRVLRGGSWNNNPDNARSANRNRNNAGNRNNSIGLRLASTLVKPEPVWSRSRRVCKRVSRVCHDENGRGMRPARALALVPACGTASAGALWIAGF
jgi:hypothetical protein